jgi:hypothetical protein
LALLRRRTFFTGTFAIDAGAIGGVGKVRTVLNALVI